MNVLWGRVVVLGVVLLLVFLLGRATGGNSAELKDLQDRLSDREAEIDQLEAANREAAEASPSPDAGAGTETGTGTGATPGTTTTPTTTTSPTPTTTTTASPSAGGNTEASNYVIKSGDTLGRISTRFYGTANLTKCIQDANASVITDPSKLQVGKSIVIPAEASCS
ncbi:MAG TPA: LysM peptidoglycan-binding domain-containing protein [Actinomycetota bacterium]|jgi:nucleoid-associated protein YgaU|nr:LysM peptidoglycan-binding domain-containing protein [Actinomycetota bacterium]